MTEDARSEPVATVRCGLCPKLCVIADGESGDCRIRVNVGGKLRAVTYGHPVAAHIDPIEKKPLFHFLPGSPIFSIATVGCNLHCLNCQNWEISQANPEETESYALEPDDLVEVALARKCPSVAYTYTEPLVAYEYTLDSCIRARDKGLRNVLVTAGFLNPKPLRRLYQYVDAANIDLKAMDEGFYRRICGAELRPVLTALELAVESNVWLEVTNLVIPTLNDSTRMLTDLARFMVEHLGPDVPLHLSGFTPRYRLKNLPPTPVETLMKGRDIAMEQGLNYVYVGNVFGAEGSNTRCPHDGTLLVERVGYRIAGRALGTDGRCPTCGRAVAGVWR